MLTVMESSVKYFYVSESIILTLLHYSPRHCIYIEIGLSKYSVIQSGSA